MLYSLDRNSKTPIYLQLYELLKNDIVSGVYPFGSRLPSKRLLAEELGISRITAEHAYELLCDEGYAASRERSGYYSAYVSSDTLDYADLSAHKTVVNSISFSKESYLSEDLSFPFGLYA